MTMEKMFEMATRKKLRFAYKGMISVEDLWDLSPEQLDAVFKALNAQLKQVTEESLLKVKSSADKELEIKIEIVRYIVNVKLEEASARMQEKERKDQRNKIMEVLAAKKDEALQNKTPEQLQAMLDELSDK